MCDCCNSTCELGILRALCHVMQLVQVLQVEAFLETARVR